MTFVEVLPYLLPLVIGAFQWLAGRSIRELDESRRRFGERIGEIEQQNASFRDKVTRLETNVDHQAIALDRIAASLAAIEHKANIIAEKLAATSGRTTQSTSSMPAVVPPRPRMPSRPGDR
jgi:hypothetical protein